MMGIIKRDLDRLEGMGVLEKVSHSQWVSLIVPVVKSDRAFSSNDGDYKKGFKSIRRYGCTREG